MKSLITTSIFAALLSIGSTYGAKPIFKQLIISHELVDSSAKTITKKKIYSYFIIDVDGGYGTYTSEEIFSFNGDLIKQLFVKENVIDEDMDKSHIIWSKLIKYQFGKVVYINITKRISDSFVVLKDVSYTVTPTGKKSKIKPLDAFPKIEGYSRPSKREIFTHTKRRQKKSH